MSDLLNWLGEKVCCSTRRTHQALALERTFASPFRDLVINTGTGSGKTEAFLLPILGRLAAEVTARSFKTRAVRALLLYPMNALVNDQLGRLRVLLGDNLLARWFDGRSPHEIRSLHGPCTISRPPAGDTDKHRDRLQSLKFYLGLEQRAASDRTRRP